MVLPTVHRTRGRERYAMEGAHGLDGLDGIDEIVQEFLVESHENLDQLDRDLVELEQNPGSRELLSSIFRTMHTIKGTSGFLAFSTLESVTHVGESLLSRLRDGVMVLTPEITTVLLELVDAVRDILANIEGSGVEGAERYDGLVSRLDAILDGQAMGPAATSAIAEAAEQETACAVVQAALLEPPLAAAATTRPAVNGHPVDGTGHEPHLSFPTAGEPSVGPDGARRSVADSSIRVDVALLDSLMNLVGELVLTRNQMLQRAATREDVELQRTTHRLNLIAGELQEGVMRTRMQPIDNVWSKLPRVVRDLSLLLGKSVDLRMEGRDTELDKTILEAVRDPLTHLVRNSVDHGIEAPAVRAAAGKPEQGVLLLRAFHEGGQVNIEITDDGAGIDPARLREKAVSRGMLSREAAAALPDRDAVHLIFSPGFSTAAEVTNVSGRGVGMDVVKTNIEKIGGGIELVSTPGLGTTVKIRIPLTLAIIPALVVSAAAHRYAIAQVNLLELVRLEPGHERAAIETVHGAPVYRLRGRLLPLVDLRAQLGLPPVARETPHIVVLQAGSQEFGLIVDDIKDTEEIVVKPLGRQLRDVGLYAGATIMGDGQVALILDATALARQAGMTLDGSAVGQDDGPGTSSGDRASLLVVAIGDGRRAAVPLGVVDRLEEFTRDRVERVGSHEVVQYRGQILPLLRLDHALQGFGQGGDSDPLQVVVCRIDERLVGVVVTGILDIVEDELAVRTHLDTAGHDGSAVIGGHVTELVDIDAAIKTFAPGLLTPSPAREF
jgi:two-component system, chemotaxis family, sensor kinase CheA